MDPGSRMQGIPAYVSQRLNGLVPNQWRKSRYSHGVRDRSEFQSTVAECAHVTQNR